MDIGFKKLIAWQKAYYFVLAIYQLLKKFPLDERFGLISQMKRSAVSIPANIAEGYERQHRKEYIQFLMIAKGSLGEIETHLLLSRDLGFIDLSSYNDLENKRHELGKLLKGLIRSLQ